jgi:cell division protein FtsQ
MDGRRRLAEPVTDRALARNGAGAAPAPRRLRERVMLGRTGFDRHLRRVLGPLTSIVWKLPRGAGVGAAVGLVVMSVGFGVVRGGHIPALIDGLADLCDSAANAAGFRIAEVGLTGSRQLPREEILAEAGVTGRSSLLFLDAGAARDRLKANPWIAEATVLKLYPNRLQITVTERNAFALWQQGGKVSVISDDGSVVEPLVSARFANLPLFVGVGAGPKAKEFLALVERYPSIRSQMRAAVLVAERRWNVVLANGIDVRLPETDPGAALDRLVQFDRDRKLLSRDIVAVDLRLPDRVTVRLSEDAHAARQEALKAKQPKKKAGAA